MEERQYGYPPLVISLYAACAMSSLSLIDRYISMELSLNDIICQGQNLLHYACMTGDGKFLHYLVFSCLPRAHLVH